MSETKTLKIFVCEVIKVSNKYKEKNKGLVKTTDKVFNVFEFSFIQELFSNINNFCRPPTSLIVNFYTTKNHLAY